MLMQSFTYLVFFHIIIVLYSEKYTSFSLFRDSTITLEWYIKIKSFWGLSVDLNGDWAMFHFWVGDCFQGFFFLKVVAAVCYLMYF